MKIKKRIYKSLFVFILLVGIVLNSFPVNAASKMSGLDFTMTKGTRFELDCWTPAGMKAKSFKLTKLQKKKMTAKYLHNVSNNKYGENEDSDSPFGWTWKHTKRDDYYEMFYNDEVLKYYASYYWDYYDDNSDNYYVYDELNDDYFYDLDMMYSVKNIKRDYKYIIPKLEVVNLRINFNTIWSPSISDINESVNTESFYNEMILIADRKSGKSLWNDWGWQNRIAKSKGVYVTRVHWHYGKKKRYYNYNGEYIWLRENGYVEVQIIKPKKYHDLCVGIMGHSEESYSIETKYMRGKQAFNNSWWYKENPDNSKWIRIK